jgi:hypothetical protein
MKKNNFKSTSNPQKIVKKSKNRDFSPFLPFFEKPLKITKKALFYQFLRKN